MQIEEHRTMTKTKAYIAIDLKSFYASVECKERNRDPLTTNLVVADQSRTEKTICLAVSPSLKSYGIPGRPRLFEVVQKIKEVNNTRRWKALNRTFTGSSDDNTELNAGVKALGEGAEKLVAGNQQVVDGVKKLQENLETSKKTMAASQDSLTQLSDQGYVENYHSDWFDEFSQKVKDI